MLKKKKKEKKEYKSIQCVGVLLRDKDKAYPKVS